MAFEFVPTEIDRLLEDEQNVSLEELLEQPDIIQECRTGNPKLVTYLKRRSILEELCEMTLRVPECGDFRAGSIAADVLACPVRSVSEAVCECVLPDLYSYIQRESVHPVTMSLVLKIFENCQSWCGCKFMNIVKSRGSLISILTRNMHIVGVSGFISDIYSVKCPLMEYFDGASLPLRMILTIPQQPATIGRLISDLMSGPVDIWSSSDGHSLLVCHQIVVHLCSMMRDPSLPHVLHILSLIFHPTPSPPLLHQLLPFVPTLASFLHHPLASTRLAVVHLFASCLQYPHQPFLRAVTREHVVEEILDLFFLSPSHSLLHCSVHRLLGHVLSFNSVEMGMLAKQLILDYRLVHKLIDVCEEEMGASYSNRRRELTAQAGDILMLIHDLATHDPPHPVIHDLMTHLGDTWTTFCQHFLHKYANDSKVTHSLVDHSLDTDEEIHDLSDLDELTYQQFLQLSSRLPDLPTLSIPLMTCPDIMPHLHFTNPFDEVDVVFHTFQPAALHQSLHNEFSAQFEQVQSTSPVLFDQVLPMASLDQIEEIKSGKLEDVQWEEEDCPFGDVWSAYDQTAFTPTPLSRQPTTWSLED